MFLLKLLLISIIKLRKLLVNKIQLSEEKVLFISIAGIGDSIYLLSAIQYYNQLTGRKVDIIIPKSSFDLFSNCDYINRTFTIDKNHLIDFNEYKYIFSNRINVDTLFKIIKSGFSNYLIVNPSYEKLRFISRIRCNLSQEYKKYYFSQFHAGLQFNKIINDIFKSEIDFPKPIIKSIKPNSDLINNFLKQNINFGLIHVAGQDDIRKISPKIIFDLTTSINVPIILVGSKNDSDLYSNISYHDTVYNGIGEFSLNEVFYLLENSNFCIAPDSSIMHLASLTKTKLIGIMGNALEQTFGPIFSENKILLSRNPICSPCSRLTCDKYNGHSCVQDITSQEIIDSINKI